ncbi:MAG: hypothetical protein ACHQNA_03390 [Acidimicrobiales bacterium]
MAGAIGLGLRVPGSNSSAEAVRVTQAAQVEPGLEEGILDSIGRVFVVTQDQPGGRKESIGQAEGQRREGIEIASLRPNHEVSLHRPALGWRLSGRAT